MERIIGNIPTMIATIMLAVLILMVVTNIFTEVLKKILPERVPTNIMAFLVAMLVTLAGFLAVCQIAGLPITWYMIAGAVALGFFVAFAAMFGFDKFKQTIEQISKFIK